MFIKSKQKNAYELMQFWTNKIEVELIYSEL